MMVHHVYIGLYMYTCFCKCHLLNLKFNSTYNWGAHDKVILTYWLFIIIVKIPSLNMYVRTNIHNKGNLTKMHVCQDKHIHNKANFTKIFVSNSCYSTVTSVYFSNLIKYFSFSNFLTEGRCIKVTTKGH